MRFDLINVHNTHILFKQVTHQKILFGVMHNAL